MANSTFEGEYVFAGGQKQRDGVAAAIETSAASLNGLIRNIGRKRLTEANLVPKQLSISLEGDKLSRELDGQGHVATLDGKPIKTQSREGEKVKVSHRVRGDKLVELIDGTSGDRRYELKLSSISQVSRPGRSGRRNTTSAVAPSTCSCSRIANDITPGSSPSAAGLV